MSLLTSCFIVHCINFIHCIHCIHRIQCIQCIMFSNILCNCWSVNTSHACIIIRTSYYVREEYSHNILNHCHHHHHASQSTGATCKQCKSIFSAGGPLSTATNYCKLFFQFSSGSSSVLGSREFYHLSEIENEKF